MPKGGSFTEEKYQAEAYRRLMPMFQIMMTFGAKGVHIEGSAPINLFSQLPHGISLPSPRTATNIKKYIESQIDEAKKASGVLARYGFNVEVQKRREGDTLIFLFWPMDITLMNQSITMLEAVRQLNGEED